MRLTKARYQHGSIAKVLRALGFAWRVRFSEISGGKRIQKSLTFSGFDYPNESDVRKAIDHAVVQQNRMVERAKVNAAFGDLTGLYRTEHMPGLGHSTQQTNRYLLASYIEPEFREVPIREMTPLYVTQWVNGLALAPTTKGSIRSVMSQCFELAALHGYLPAFERNPMSLVKIKGTSKRQKKITRLHIGQVRNLLEKLPEPINIMTLVTASLGLRISETLAPKWSDIDRKSQEMSIARKFTHGALGETKTDASTSKEMGINNLNKREESSTLPL